MYTKFKFAVELKDNIENGVSPAAIGEWAYTIYLKNCENNYVDEALNTLLLELNHMSNGPEFELSKANLLEISKLIIEGKDVDIDKYF